MNRIKSKAVFQIFLIISTIFISSIALAQEPTSETPFTCLETTDNRKCIGTTVASICKEGKIRNVLKENLPECKPVCCIKEDGSYFENVPFSQCSGEKRDGICSSFPDLKQMCCIYGDQYKLTTEKGCYDLKSKLEFQIDPRIEPANSEQECSNFVRKEEFGCCIRELGNACTWEQDSTCDGEFFRGLACNKIQDPNKCNANEGEEIKVCDESSNRIKTLDSRNQFTGKEENCNSLDGKVCVNGECVDKSCLKGNMHVPSYIENSINPVRNGESWCWYDSKEGPAGDLPGSRQYIHRCLNSKEEVDELPQDRSEICMNVVSNTIVLHQAIKRQNRYKYSDKTCMECTTKDCCEDPRIWDCVWAGNEKGVCIPLTPPSPHISDTQSNTFPQAECNTGKFKTQDSSDNIGILKQNAAWYNTLSSGFDWECTDNCELYLPEYANSMNTICASYGDCGADFGLNREWTNDGFERTCGESRNKLRKDAEVDDEVTTHKYSSNTLIRGCKIEIPKPENKGDYFKVKGTLTLKTIGISNYHETIGLSIGAAGVAVFLSALAIKGWAALAVGMASNPILAITAVVITLVALGWWALETIFGEKETETIQSSCKPWQPVKSSEYCNLCHEAGQNGLPDLTVGGTHECTQYLCLSLGQGCQFIKTDEMNKCVPKDTTSNPGIGPLDEIISLNKCINNDGGDISCELEPNNDNGYKIGPKIKTFTDITIGVKTFTNIGKKEEFPTQCKIAEERISSYDDGIESVYKTEENKIEHKFEIEQAYDLPQGEEINYYVKCITYDGKESQVDYQIQFEINPQIPTSPPTFEIKHENNFLVPNSLNKTIVTLSPINQPMKVCKYDNVNVPFEEMKFEKECDNDCELSIQDLTEEGIYNYFVKCEDNNSNRNSEVNPPEFTITKTKKLEITGLECKDELTNDCNEENRYFSALEITATTSGGAEDGKATCGGTQSSALSPILFEFSNTGSILHTGLKLSGLTTLNNPQLFNIVCEDKAKNIANKKISFNLLKDDSFPIMEKVYTSGQQLVVETNEESECKYASTSEKLFNEPQSFSTSNKLIHTATIGVQNKFIVLCSDVFKNSFEAKTIYLNR